MDLDLQFLAGGIMARMDFLNKKIILVAIVISMFANVMEARELECSYDHVTYKIVKKISETNNGVGDLDYIYHYEFGSGGREMWSFDEVSPTSETKSSEPYVNMWGNMFQGNNKYFSSIVYINFETVKFHEIQAIDAYLKNAENIPHGYIESNRMLEVPLMLWDCKRLD